MGMFGGDKKKKQENEAKPGSTQRRSRRIVTPGSKGAPPEGPAKPGSNVVRRRPSGPAVSKPTESGPVRRPPSQRMPAQQPALRPTAPSAAPPAPQQGQGRGPVVGRAPAPPPPPRQAGKQPIVASDELEFTGSLAGAEDVAGLSRTGDRPLLDFLVNKAALLDSAQSDKARQMAAADGLPIDVACVRMGVLTEDQLVNALTQECWVPHLKVDKYEIRKKALDTIDEADAKRFGVLPVDKLGSILNLAMVNPLDLEAIRILESKTGLDIKKVVATRSEIDQGIERYYGGSESASEGSRHISQDHDSRRVTHMLSRVSGEEAAPAAAATVRDHSTHHAPPVADISPDILDIDDLLGGDEAVAPSIVEPISIDPDEIEPEIEPELAPDQVNDFDDFEPEGLEPLTPIGGAARRTPLPADQIADEDALDFADDEPLISRPPPRPAPAPVVPEAAPAAPVRPAAAVPPAPAKKKPARAAFVNLVPVMEEEFQHAITHGKSRVFDKWVSLQTRNRILNAVPVEDEVSNVLVGLYSHGQRLSA